MNPGSASSDTPPLSWCDALEAEFLALRGVPALGDQAPRDPEARLRAVHARIHQQPQGTSALCLSGGGIRSATFALGVLQGLAHAGVLRHIDYLSTVSGGGYTGGWLTTWLHREGAAGRDDVMRELDPTTAALTGALDDPSPVDRLRRTCRYLAPSGGVVSADVWTLVMTMARNLALNWLVILPLLAAALLVPRLYYAAVHAIETNAAIRPCSVQALAGTPMWFLVAFAAGFVTASAYIVLNFVGRGGQWSQGRFLSFFLVPSVVSAVAFTLFWSATPCPFDPGTSIFLGAVVPAAGWLVVGGARHGIRGVAITLVALALGLTAIWSVTDRLGVDIPTREGWRALGTVILLPLMAWFARRWVGKPPANDGSTLRLRIGGRTVIAALVSGPIMGYGTYWFASDQFGFGTGLTEFYAAFTVPFLLILALLNMVVFLGIASSEVDDSALEWWSRTCGWIAIAAVLWAGAGFLVFYTADWIEAGVKAITSYLEVDHGTASALLTVVVPLFSSLAGLAARGGGKSQLKLAMQKVALPLVILLLLASIAWADLRLVLHFEQNSGVPPCATDGTVVNPCYAPGAELGPVAILFGSLLLFGLLMSRTVPVNRFSLHGMYRQRLIRTFLGASRRDRKPNAFTGFDSQDDMRVHDLADVRPLHVINTTLNAVESTHVGRHEKKAQSMTFSPLHVGNRFVGYRPADKYGSDGARRGHRYFARHGARRVRRGRELRDGHLLVEGARVPADARQRAARVVVRQPAKRDDVAAQRTAARGRAPCAGDAGTHDRPQSLRLPVRRRSLRESRAVGDGRAPLPLHHRLRRRLRSGL